VHLATGNPTCELCLAPFVFDLVYGAAGRPQSLPVCDVLNEMCGGVLRVIPFWLRTIFAACLWLIVMPMMVGLNFQLIRLVAMNSSGLSASLDIVVNFLAARFNAPSTLFSSFGMGGISSTKKSYF
jgi:E3 ubiquitin-protein ligase DOA10